MAARLQLVVGAPEFENGALTNRGRRYGDRPGDDSAGGPPRLQYIICQSRSTRLHLTCARPQPILRDCRLAFRRACNSLGSWLLPRLAGKRTDANAARYRGPTQELIPLIATRVRSQVRALTPHLSRRGSPWPISPFPDGPSSTGRCC